MFILKGTAGQAPYGLNLNQCVFIVCVTAVPIIKLFAWGRGDNGISKSISKSGVCLFTAGPIIKLCAGCLCGGCDDRDIFN